MRIAVKLLRRYMLSVQIVAMVMTMHIPDLQQREDGLLEDCLGHLEDSLQDPCYAARRYAALILPSLYVRLADRYEHPSGNPAEVVRTVMSYMAFVQVWLMLTDKSTALLL